MNADTASPTSAPAPAPLGGPQPPVPVPGATTPPAEHGHVQAEPNALMEWSKKAWAGLKEGQVGNPKLLLLIAGVVLVLAAWWFLANSSKVAESALWTNSELAVNAAKLKTFTGDASQKDTTAGRIASLNELRLRKTDAQRKLRADKLADRQAAADELAKVRGELEEAAGLFPNDRSLRAAAFLAAAEAELALVGIPNKDVGAMGLEVKANSRGQLDRYAKLMKQAAEAIGANTPAGEQFTAEAEKYAKELDATELYSRLGYFHANFNNPDPVGRPTDPSDPTGGVIPGGGPKKPDGLPPLPGKPDDVPAGDLPKPPVDPFPGEKK